VTQCHLRSFVCNEARIGHEADPRNDIVNQARISATGFRSSVSTEDGIPQLALGYEILGHAKYTNVGSCGDVDLVDLAFCGSVGEGALVSLGIFERDVFSLE
jgi:hypothetical protein